MINTTIQANKLAMQEVLKRQKLAEKGFFNNEKLTIDIEQEVQVLDRRTAKPINVESYIKGIPGSRTDTTVFNIEFDGGKTALDCQGILSLYESFFERTQKMQSSLQKLNKESIAVFTGAHPFLTEREGRSLVVSDPEKRKRYDLMDRQTIKENPEKILRIEVSNTSIVETASNLTAMTRCSGTQIHISSKTVKDALRVHNILIAVAPVMVAIFGNSIFLNGLDTGLASVRTVLLKQAEQLRSGLPKPAYTLYEYYLNQLAMADSPFEIVDNTETALNRALGAIHTTSRVQVDLNERTIRNEIRMIDSQSPYRAVQALVLLVGLIEGLKNKMLPTYKESLDNFNNSANGIKATMQIHGRKSTIQNMTIDMITLAEKSLKKLGMNLLVMEFIKPLNSDLKNNITQAISIRKKFKKLIGRSYPNRKAIINILMQNQI